MKLFRVLLLIVLLGEPICAQIRVIIPENNLFSGYSLQEYILWHSNWGYDSYDLFAIDSYMPSKFSPSENHPTLFINGQKININYLSKGSLFFPSILPDNIDSIRTDLNSLFKNGYPTPNGSIELFVSGTDKKIWGTYGLVNQINDPGPHETTSLKTQNVEWVDRIRNLGTQSKGKFNIWADYQYHNYSRSNFLVYDNIINSTLFLRTFQKNLYRALKTNDIKVIGNFTDSNHKLSFAQTFIYRPSQFYWNELSGTERIDRFYKNNTSVSYKSLESKMYRGSSINYYFTIVDPIRHFDTTFDEINTQTVEHLTSFSFTPLAYDLDVSISNQVSKYYNNQSYDKLYINHHLQLALSQSNGSQFFESIIGTSTNLFQINLSSWSLRYSRSLVFNKNPFHNFIDDRFSLVKTNQIDGLTLNEDKFSINYFQLNRNFSFQKGSLKVIGLAYFKHYTNFIDKEVFYEPIPSSRRTTPIISYENLKNIGLIGADISMNIPITNNLFAKSLITAFRNVYGDIGSDSFESIPSILYTQYLNYRLDENAIFELSYKYIPERELADYTFLQENNLWPPTTVRSISLLNLTTKMWFVDKRVLGTLTLRNLLNSTESYNTNGQYYNLSIYVTLALRL